MLSHNTGLKLKGENMKDNYFEETRGLVYEIRDIAQLGLNWVVNEGVDKTDTDTMLALLGLFQRNADEILNLFSAIELIPGVGTAQPRLSTGD